MTSLSDDFIENHAHDQAAPSAAHSETRPIYWSVRRELWENRWVYIAPTAVAALVLLGFLISMVTLPQRRRATLAMDAARQAASVAEPYAILAAVMLLTTAVVGAAYCLGALHGERRDRSILFWKSLPVSDFTTVAAKAFIPLVALPTIALVLTFALQTIVLAVGTLVLAANGVAELPPGTQVSLLEMMVAMTYAVVVSAMWWAPLYAWLLLVSGWAKRAPFLWAVFPPLILCLVERIAFGTSHLWRLLIGRLAGASAAAFTVEPRPASGHGHAVVGTMRLSHLAPLHFLSSLDLWIGLAVAAAFLAAAVWWRRRAESI